ncbi:hypothetical protein SAMN05421858_3570 [Haladaptatus litoreus]|uniref:Uncharacterized protein n=1 Tax=Haladaptatus litoreus TaxID=553468 RepID=A0A1N7DEW5_9EURY|nr:hypothetical protein SAMN05421858_3570 [Haladaptatus litoreus]
MELGRGEQIHTASASGDPIQAQEDAETIADEDSMVTRTSRNMGFRIFIRV